MTVEFRIVHTLDAQGQVIGERWQYRRREVSLNLGVIQFASWSNWTDVSTVVVTESA